ncbi:MAG: cytochrome c oxidase subunit 3 [Bdellovibrionota bacterium]
MAMFIAVEAMFFAGLASAFLVLRAGSGGTWPPLGQPRLPLEVTALNTLVLLASGAALILAERAALQGQKPTRLLPFSLLLGALFLAIQGSEWLRLIAQGLTLTSSVYGGLFYTLIGAHALHVLGGLAGAIWYWYSIRKSERLRDAEKIRFRVVRMYWLFVVGLWPVLYVLVYF